MKRWAHVRLRGADVVIGTGTFRAGDDGVLNPQPGEDLQQFLAAHPNYRHVTVPDAEPEIDAELDADDSDDAEPVLEKAERTEDEPVLEDGAGDVSPATVPDAELELELELAAMSVKDLRKEAKARGVALGAARTKDKIIEALTAASETPPVA